MLATTLPSALTKRTFSTSSAPKASVLFALSSLSNSRETQHFNKLSRLDRVEHSPPLKLIEQSEVHPFPLPTPPPRLPEPETPGTQTFKTAAQVWDEKALSVGRAVLAGHARQVGEMELALQRERQRAVERETEVEEERLAWLKERAKSRAEMRQAGVLLLLSIGTATGLATWRFWPEKGGVAAVADSGAMGRKIAERAQGAMSGSESVGSAGGLEPVVQAAPLATASATQAAGTAPAPAVEPALASLPPVASTSVTAPPTTSWWQNLFWKQQ